MATKIFKSYEDFKNRPDKTVNGVSEDFAAEHSNWQEMNGTNTGCWDCFKCTDCNYCHHCNHCNGCNDCFRCKHCNDCDDCKYCDYCDDCKHCKGCKRVKRVKHVKHVKQRLLGLLLPQKLLRLRLKGGK